MTKGNGKTVYKWTPTQQQDFEKLKNNICTAPVLVLPYLHHPFNIVTDASDYALGEVITHYGHPIAFHSENFNDTISVDVYVTSKCIHLYFLCIVTLCLFRDVFVMYLSHVMPRCSDREDLYCKQVIVCNPPIV